MSKWQTNLGWGTLVAVCAGMVWLAWSPGVAQVAQKEQQKTPAPETLLPADAVLYVNYEGMALHGEEFKKTAAYQALYETGLIDSAVKLLDAIQQQSGQAEQFAVFRDLYETLSQDGVSLAAAVSAEQGPPQAYGVLVLHGGAKFEPQLAKFVKEGTRNEVKFETKTVSGRRVTSGILPDSPGVELGWWTEGRHLTIAVGQNAVESAVAVASGKSPNVTQHPLWKKYRTAETSFNVTSLNWLDLGGLRKTFGEMPLPQAGPDAPKSTVNDVLKAVGMDNVGAFVSRSGYKDEALWSDLVLETPQPRTGVLSYVSQKPVRLENLPPMPAGTMAFHACTVDWSKVYGTTTTLARNLSAFAPPDAAAQVEGLIQNLPAIVGFDPDKALFQTLGDVSCVYADSELSLFGIGIGVVQQVKDADTLKDTLMSLVGRAAEQTTPQELVVKKTKKHGREIITLEIANGIFNPSFAIADGWLVVGLYPQTVESFFLRLDGKLDRWEPSDKLEAALKLLPKEFTSITVTDPEAGVRMVMGIAPLMMAGMQAAWRESPMGREGGPLPISIADLPPAELVTKPLFPNVTMQTVTKDGIHSTSRTSLPGLPLISSGGGAPTAAVAIALLLPAVQQAREAARRSQSRNNLKQLGIAMHNFHDTHKNFPTGTHPNEKLKPEKRLSWIASILPFLDQDPLHNKIKFDEAWDSDANEQFTSTVIPVLQNPSMAADANGKAVTHYVGIAGVGKDAATLPVTSKKAGVFGYNRSTSFRDIRDGTSNTVMISEAAKDLGPWAAGGKDTIRALTTKPYINGPDGLGGNHAGGCLMLMGDGSVRFISENVDPDTMEALSTIAGGEVIGDF